MDRSSQQIAAAPVRSLAQRLVASIGVGLVFSVAPQLIDDWFGWFPTLRVPAGAWPRFLVVLTVVFAMAGLCAWMGDRRPRLWRHYYASAAAGVLFWIGITGTAGRAALSVWLSLGVQALMAAILGVPLAFVAREVTPAFAPPDTSA